MYKKIFNPLVCLCLFSLIIIGCNEKEEPRFLELDKTALVFSSDRESQTIELLTNGNWSASWGVGWLVVSPRQGNGNTTVTITALENELFGERKVALVFRSGTETATVEVTQQKANFLELDETTFVFEDEGGSQNISVSSNGIWTVSNEADWITVSPQSGVGNATVVVNASENETFETRETTLTFSSGTKTVTVGITQKAKFFIELDKTVLVFEANSGSQNISVSSNGTWTVSNEANWITVSPQSGQGNATVIVDVLNEVYRERKAILTFGNRAKNATVTIMQEAKTMQGVIINGVHWANSNVDAPGTFAESPESSGMFYQWNRRRGWPSTGWVSDWHRSAATGDTWERANDPCPLGWRVPTQEEILTLVNSGSEWTTVRGVAGRQFGTYPNIIFLPAAGWRDGDGTLLAVGASGLYWSSTVAGTGSRALHFFSITVISLSSSRVHGFSVRCVAE